MRLNLAARAGRWSAAHWKTATFGWIAFVVAAVLLGGAVGTKTLADNEGIPGESGRMEKILDANFKQPAGETVLIQSDTAHREEHGVRRRRSATSLDRVSVRSRPSPTSAARWIGPTRTRLPPTAARRSSASTSAEIPRRPSTRSIR